MGEIVRTVEQVVMGLALQDKDSCGYDGRRVPDSCTCQEHDCICHSIGFKEVHGQVAKFPMLRESCRVIVLPSGIGGPKIHPEPPDWLQCPVCEGRRWVTVTADVTAALLEAGKPWHIGVVWDGTEWRAEYDNPEWPHQTYYKPADTKEIALALALEAAKGANDAR